MPQKKLLHSKFYELFLENVCTYIIIQNRAIQLMKKESDELKDEFTKTIKPQVIQKDVYIGVMKKIFPEYNLDFNKFKEIHFRNHIIYLYSELEFYFYRCLNHIFVKRPNLLEEKNISLSIKSILDKDYNLDEEVQKKLDKAIEQKLRKDFNDFFDYCSKKLGLKHKLPQEDINELKKFRQIRNLYVHGDGTINELFFEKYPDSPFKIGEKFEINEELLNNLVQKLIKILDQFDEQMLKAYSELGIETSKSFVKRVYKPTKISNIVLDHIREKQNYNEES